MATIVTSKADKMRIALGRRSGPKLTQRSRMPRRHRSLSLPSAQPIIAVENAALDGPQGLHLLAQGFFPLLPLLVCPIVLLFGSIPLASEALHFPDQALPLGELRR